MKASGFLFVFFGMTATAAPVAYPDRPIRFIVPFAPGGTNDILARLIAERLSTRVGHTLVVDYRAGTNGIR
jgi:tripartite-type tricarboxylate transporter receptor subunit TctC